MRTEIQATINASLHGLTDRQKALANNLSNIETPGFLAKRVDFESALKRAISTDSAVNLKTRRTVSLDETNVNGNNVNLDNETVSAVETELRYQAMISAMNSQFRTLRTAMG